MLLALSVHFSRHLLTGPMHWFRYCLDMRLQPACADDAVAFVQQQCPTAQLLNRTVDRLSISIPQEVSHIHWNITLLTSSTRFSFAKEVSAGHPVKEAHATCAFASMTLYIRICIHCMHTSGLKLQAMPSRVNILCKQHRS